MREDELLRLADMSKIALSDKEKRAFCDELDDMLALMESVCECREREKAAQTCCTAESLREDEAGESLSKEDTVKNAKDRIFCVPRTVE